MKSASRKIAGAYPKSPEPELEVILDIAENAFVLYDSAGVIRLASWRLTPLLHLTDSERSSLRDFESFSRLLSRRLAKRDGQIRAPWILWQPGAGVGREELELGEGGQILERIVRPITYPSGQAPGWVERYRDFTGDRELPARLLQTDKLAALGQMVAGITHELNNPLTTIMGYGHLLLERPLDAKSHDEVQRICQEAERAARIVRNLLLLARNAKIERSPVNLNEIIDRTLRLCTYDLRRSDIQVDADLDPQLPDTLANPVQLQQVVLNLLLNSQQAIASAGRTGRIAIRTRHDADRIILHVEDNGPGIAPGLQPRIFEPFFTTKPVGVGTGLGLAIVAGILRQHGADIQLAKSDDSGTTFVISLPVAQTQPKPSRVSPVLVVPSSVRRRVLVVEAEPGLGRLIVDALSESGYAVELASDETQALDRAKDTNFDLIICDENIRENDGPDLYRALGSASGLGVERLLMIGPDPSLRGAPNVCPESQPASLVKPFQLPELKEAVAKFFANQTDAGRAPSAVEAT